MAALFEISLFVKEGHMDVSTLNMNNRCAFKTLSHQRYHLKSKPWVRSALWLTLLASPMLHADDLADLIRTKNQSYAQAPAVRAPLSTAYLNTTHPSFYQNYAAAPNIDSDYIETLYRAEQVAAPASKQVLQVARQMALDNKEIIKGSCWDYLNAAFNRAGVARETVFKGAYQVGPFIDTNQIQPGDWLYYINHSYNDVEHSGLFVGWLNRANNQALILSYAGERRNEPARYKVYDVSHTYNVIRPSL
ncbi:hypothetical protein GB996_07755 [Psychrobacter sanguinis]|uniref:Uncharacterized protein n=2 Tax=Psychrobacter TaxID=497 RepID=A0A844M153_9GAMM|nr:hypothetical protein [Psychrobacter sanguinis]